MLYLCSTNERFRDVAQLVAHTSGGREVASSSLVIPTLRSEAAMLRFLHFIPQVSLSHGFEGILIPV